MDISILSFLLSLTVIHMQNYPTIFGSNLIGFISKYFDFVILNYIKSYYGVSYYGFSFLKKLHFNMLHACYMPYENFTLLGIKSDIYQFQVKSKSQFNCCECLLLEIDEISEILSKTKKMSR